MNGPHERITQRMSMLISPYTSNEYDFLTCFITLSLLSLFKFTFIILFFLVTDIPLFIFLKHKRLKPTDNMEIQVLF